MEKEYELKTFKDFGEWQANRRFGGTSASAVMGVSKYTNELDIYCSFVAPSEEEKSDDNVSTQYGKVNEPLLRDIFAINFQSKFDVHTPTDYEMYLSKKYPFASATLDGILTDKATNENWVLEIKTREIRTRADEEEWNGHLPQQYFVQVLHYLAVMNDFVGAWLMAKLRWLDFDTGLPIKEEIRYYELKREDFEKDIEYLMQKESEFYENHIVKRIPPSVEIKL